MALGGREIYEKGLLDCWRCHLKLSIWSCDSPDFLITPGIRNLGTGADTLNSVQASYFESFHFWTLQTVEHDDNGTRNSMLRGL
jgi:hypothetical protein